MVKDGLVYKTRRIAAPCGMAGADDYALTPGATNAGRNGQGKEFNRRPLA